MKPTTAVLSSEIESKEKGPDRSLRYSCTFWSSAPGHDPAQVIVSGYSSLWGAWWALTKMLWRSRRFLQTAQAVIKKPDPTKVPSAEYPSVQVE